MEDLIEKYELLRADYNKIIVEAFDTKDFSDYTENLFTAHSCAIEGNSFSVNDTRELKEKGLSLKIHNHSLLEAFEILDHFKAYEYAMNNLDKSLSEEFIKELHYRLTENTLKYKVGTNPGEYTNTDMAAGDTLFGDHKKNIELVPGLLEQTERALKLKKLHPVILAAKFHKFFIYLHPFKDGNGRLGRLLSNFILTKEQHPHLIITSEKKEDYINALKASEKHRTTAPIETFFLQTAINRMTNEISQKKNLTENFFLKFKEPEKIGSGIQQNQEQTRGFRR